jgi:hypothetical protein
MLTSRPAMSGFKSTLAIVVVLCSIAFVSAVTTYMGPTFAMVALGGGLASVLLLLQRFKKHDDRGWIFFGAFLLPVALALVLKITKISLFGPWQAAIILASTLGFSEYWRSTRKERLLQWFTASFLLFLLLSAFSTLFGRSKPLATFYQLISDLKPFLAVVLGYALRWDAGMEKVLRQSINWLWLPALAFVAFEWIAPGSYFNVFPGGAGKLSPDPSGILPSRALGFFEHPSFLASFAASILILISAKILFTDGLEQQNVALSSVYALLLLFAVQRQELVACILSIFLIYLLANPAKLQLRLLIVAVLGSALSYLFWLVFSENIQREMALWGTGTFGPIEHPRAQIFTHAVELATQYFPMGSGLGTFAGAGAEKFDTSLYEQLGFRNYWWYGRQDFLMDTYWPNSIAETGFLGAITLLVSYLFLLSYGIKKAIHSNGLVGQYWASAAALMGYTLMLSTTSPAFQDPRLFLLPALFFGIATRVEARARDDKA